MGLQNEIRGDCDSFELKENADQTGECWTDGHCLCRNCKNIASFKLMGERDNRDKFYPQEQKLADFQYLIEDAISETTLKNTTQQ